MEILIIIVLGIVMLVGMCLLRTDIIPEEITIKIKCLGLELSFKTKQKNDPLDKDRSNNKLD